MGMPKKGARAITVDGVEYLWRVRRRMISSRSLTWGPMSIAVTLARTPGSTLVVSLDPPHPRDWILDSPIPAIPSNVATLIRAALKAGWQPGLPGKPFEMRWRSPETEGVE